MYVPSTSMNLREHLLKTGVEEELRRVIYHLAGSAKYIANMMGESNRKLSGTDYLSTERQVELDILSNQILIDRLRRDTSFGIYEFASEETDRILRLNTNSGHYSVFADPLDGSPLAYVNLSIGTIIGICSGGILEGKCGRDSLVAAMYIQYGPLTTLVYSARNGVHEFVLDPTGNYILATEDIRMKDKGSIYSPGGLKREWLPEHTAFIAALEDQGYKLRYSGGLVADISQILLKRGGIFTYPALKASESGKLRVLFELQPMALLVEQADGLATDGRQAILDIVPDDMDQRSPAYLGSKTEVQMAAQFLARA